MFCLTDSERMIQRLSLQNRLPIHAGCVNTICWDETGEFILSGSDDRKLKVEFLRRKTCGVQKKSFFGFQITNAFFTTVSDSINTSHLANVFSARFMPGGTKVLSSDAHGLILLRGL